MMDETNRRTDLTCMVWGGAGVRWTGGVLALTASRLAAQHHLIRPGAAPPVRVAANAGDEATITIDNFTLTPQSMTVAPGTRVTRTNRDDIPHTIVSTEVPRTLVSPPLDSDDQFAFTFATPGPCHNFCSLHPHVQGMVVVR